MPGAEEALRVAAGHGPEMALLTVVVLAIVSAFGFIARWLIKSQEAYRSEAAAREERLAKRVSDLEMFVEQTLLRLVNDCSAVLAANVKAVDALTNALNQRLCILDPAKADVFIDRVIDKIADASKGTGA